MPLRRKQLTPDQHIKRNQTMYVKRALQSEPIAKSASKDPPKPDPKLQAFNYTTLYKRNNSRLDTFNLREQQQNRNSSGSENIPSEKPNETVLHARNLAKTTIPPTSGVSK